MPIMDGYRLSELIKATESGWYDFISNEGNIGKVKTLNKCRIVAITAM